MACNDDDMELEGKINHWCNVSGEGMLPDIEEANARGSIYCLALWNSYCEVWQCSSWLTSASLPISREGQTQSAVRPRLCNLCLWFMDIPSKWRPVYVLYHASLCLFWLGLWLNSLQFHWWWTSGFIGSSHAGQSIKALCQDRHAKCTVTCGLWPTVCALASPTERDVLQRVPLWLLWGMRH